MSAARAPRRPEKVTILGGGPAGLAVGYYARRAGLPFEIIEAAASPGGNCVTWDHGGYRFDSGAHHEMAWKHAADQPVVRGLIDWYAATIAELGRDPLAAVPWAFGTFADGNPVPAAARLVYRERLDLQRAFPDPFAAGGFPEWWENQGRIEYPALFDEQASAAALSQITGGLSPGFRGGVGSASVAQGLRQALARAATDASFRSRLTGRAWEILTTEGLSGVIKRLAR